MDEFISHNVFHLAAQHYMDYMGLPEYPKDPFINYLGYPPHTLHRYWVGNANKCKGGWMLPQETAKKIRLLAGPHYYAILRAMEVRK